MKRQQSKKPVQVAPPVPFPITISDELLAWGRDPEVATHFAKPWAHEIEALCKAAQQQSRALTERETDRLINMLEALIAEAIRRGRGDLAIGVDMFTAEWLGLRYSFQLDDGRRIEIGEGGKYTWSEMRQVMATDDPKAAIVFLDSVKDLLADSFPGARLTDLHRNRHPDAEAPGDVIPEVCGSCGQEGSRVMLITDTGTSYHMRCWLRLMRA